VRIVDANVLLNAVNTSGDHYHDAHDWLDEAPNGNDFSRFPGIRWVTPRPS